MAAFLDVCRFTPTAGGTTDWTYSAAVTGYQSPAAAGAVNGAIYRYRAESADLTQWELGFGAYNSGTGVFARTTVLFNSLGTTAKVNFTVAPQVAIVALAEDIPSLTAPNAFTDATASTSTATGALTVAGGVGIGGALVAGGKGGFGISPTCSFEISGVSTDPFVDQYRATMYVHTANGGGSVGLAFGNLGAAGVGTQCVIQNVLNRATGGVTTASALLTSTQDAGNATFAADWTLQTSINATLGTRLYVSKTGGVTIGATTDAGANNLLGVGSILSNSASAGIGYATGAGGTVAQATSKSTGVTLNKASGQITMNAAALAAGVIVSFVLTDTAIAATDVLILNHISGGTPGSYSLNARCAAGSATIDVRNNTGGSLSEAIVIQFALIKAVNA